MAFFALGFTACSDSDGGGGQPEITGVRVCDPEKADSLFTKSAQGQVIAIIGNNLNSATGVYINDQKVGFSTTMNTDHSIIVTVPSESDGFELTAFNSDLKDEIRVETTHGIATYAFKVLGAGPVLQRIQGTYPRSAGDILNVYGLNLYSIESIYFTDATAEEIATTEWEVVPGNHTAVTDYKVVKQDRYINSSQNYEVSSQLSLTTPDLPYSTGTLVIECAAGIVYVPYYKTPGKPVILSVSSDMPVIGEQLVITGQEFVQVESVSFGDVTLTADDFTVAETEDQIIIDIDKVPSKGSGSTLTVTTPGGVGTFNNFFAYGCLLNDFDSDVTDEGWGPNAEYGTFGVGGTGNVAHLNSYGQWWGQMIFFKKDWSGDPLPLPSYDVIPASASTDNLYFTFEVYDGGSDYNNDGTGFQGYLRYSFWYANHIAEGEDPDVLYDNFAWVDYDKGTFENPDGKILQDINGEAHVGKWYRHVCKLSNMTAYKGKTYQDVVNNGIGIVRIMSFTQGTKTGNVDVYIDNIRLVYIP
ncbi:MAG: hypothetical protein IJV44_11935 [Prevotella sp.]|nr:hypothetical protein [Prevotella sp.]